MQGFVRNSRQICAIFAVESQQLETERTLSFHMSSRTSFSDYTVCPAAADAPERWWSISGRAIHDELGRGHVYANDYFQIRVLALPLGELTTGLGEDTAANIDHQSGLFGDGDEFVRREQAPSRVLPTNERLNGQ